MNTSDNFLQRLLAFLHTQFPDSLEIPPQELADAVRFMLEKAVSYGFETEVDQVNYVVTAYLLGLHFDTEFPAATEVLTDSALTGTEKANWLQQWTEKLFATLEGGQIQQQESSQVIEMPEADMSTYLDMQENAGPYAQLAEEVIKQLIEGNISGLRENFSLKFLNQIGYETFEKVCAEIIMPFFENARTLGNSSTVTHTTNSFGNTGFAFYRTIIADGVEKPFIIYMVWEDTRIVVANLVVNKTYADMH
jgi:hypothetical protein